MFSRCSFKVIALSVFSINMDVPVFVHNFQVFGWQQCSVLSPYLLLQTTKDSVRGHETVVTDRKGILHS